MLSSIDAVKDAPENDPSRLASLYLQASRFLGLKTTEQHADARAIEIAKIIKASVASNDPSSVTFLSPRSPDANIDTSDSRPNLQTGEESSPLWQKRFNEILLTGINVLQVETTSTYEPEFNKIDPTQTFVEWNKRSDREGHVFAEGEQVLVRAKVIVRKGRLSLVADDQDGRMADEFYPTNIGEETATKLLALQGQAVGCIVKIKKNINGEDQISDIHEYEVELKPEIILPPLNPNEAQKSLLPIGAPATIEGELVSFENNIYTIKASNGEMINVQTASSRADVYGTGVLANIENKKIEYGEQVKIAVFMRENKGHKLPQAQFNQLHLIKASARRIAEFSDAREKINTGFSELRLSLSEGRFQGARKVFAQLRTQELINEEINILFELIKLLPDEEKPIFKDREKQSFFAQQLDTYFGVAVESMNLAQFITFSREVACGERAQIQEGSCDHSYVFLLLRSMKVPDEIIMPIIIAGMDGRLKKLTASPDESQAFFEDSYTLNQCLKYSTYINSPQMIKKFLEITRYLMQNKYYNKGMNWREEQGCPQRFRDLLAETTQSLAQSLRKYPQNIITVEEMELSQWINELSQYPLCNESIRNLQLVKGYMGKKVIS